MFDWIIIFVHIRQGGNIFWCAVMRLKIHLDFGNVPQSLVFNEIHRFLKPSVDIYRFLKKRYCIFADFCLHFCIDYPDCITFLLVLSPNSVAQTECGFSYSLYRKCVTPDVLHVRHPYFQWLREDNLFAL